MEEEGALIVVLEHSPFLVLDDGRELQEVSDEEDLHPAEGEGTTACRPEHEVDEV